MRKFLLLIFVSLIASTAFAQPLGRGFTSATEEDGSPQCYGWQLKFANGNVTDNGDGTCSIADQNTGGGGGSVSNYNDIGDPTDISGINFSSYTNTWTSTVGNATFFTIDGSGTDFVVQGDGDVFTDDLDVTGNITVSGTVDGVDIAARDHDAVTLAGTPDYITISGQVITRGTVDISDDTNLTGDTEIVLTGDALSIASSIARDSELHSAVTVSGTPDYITLSGQDIVRGTVDISDDTNLAVTAPVVLTGDTLSLNQNAGTDITADLEEETHASEHLENGADELTVEGLGTACPSGQTFASDGSGGVDCSTASGSTAYDDIGDPDGVSGINFAGFTNVWTSSIGNANFFTIDGSSDFIVQGDGDVSVGGELSSNGNKLNYEAISSSDTLDANNDIVFCSGTTTINLPTAVGIGGKVYTIVHTDSNVCTVDPFSTQTINGVSTKELAFSGSSMQIVSDNSNWRIK